MMCADNADRGIEGFDENLYLQCNPDVAAAVRAGRINSGLEHFMRHGYREKRKGLPPTFSVRDRERLDRDAVERYWQDRENSVYLQHVRALVSYIGRRARSILDVGSNGCPYLDWFSWIPRRVSVDIERPYYSTGVSSVKADLMTVSGLGDFDLCICLQVLEHIQSPEVFARKLLSLSKNVLISVPYKWPITDQTIPMGHLQDPVDEAKIEEWFGRTPDFSLLSVEHNTNIERLVCVFEGNC